MKDFREVKSSNAIADVDQPMTHKANIFEMTEQDLEDFTADKKKEVNYDFKIQIWPLFHQYFYGFDYSAWLTPIAYFRSLFECSSVI